MTPGAWLPDQTSTLSPSTCTVALSGSMQTWETCSEKYSAVITLAAPLSAASASPFLTISMPGLRPVGGDGAVVGEDAVLGVALARR